MHERRRAVRFPNPMIDLELDPEKELWVPGKKKFFIPSITKVEMYEGLDVGREFSWDLETKAPTSIYDPVFANLKRVTTQELDAYFEENARREAYYRALYETACCECVPGRHNFIVPTREEDKEAAKTWNDVRRSTEPNFRSRRAGVMYERPYRRWEYE